MHPFLYRFMPSPAAGTPRNLGEYPNLPEGQAARADGIRINR